MKKKIIAIATVVAMLSNPFMSVLAFSQIELVSVGVDYSQANGSSSLPRISGNGKFVSFYSSASNLVPSDTNSAVDVFVRDLENNTTELISVTQGGTQGNAISQSNHISDDGRYVAFQSSATNLVPNDTNAQDDAFLKDRVTGILTRVSTTDTGAQATSPGQAAWPRVSPDGRKVIFQTYDPLDTGDNNGRLDVYQKNTLTEDVRQLTFTSTGGLGSNQSYAGVLTDSERYLIFSAVGPMVPGVDFNGRSDVYLRDLQLGTVELISANNSGLAGARFADNGSISNDAMIATFHTDSVLVPEDTNGTWDTYVRNRNTNTTMLLSASSTGVVGTGGASYIEHGALTPDGRYVVFHSAARNLVAGDTNNTNDIFLRDLQLGTITRVSTTDTGAQANGSSFAATISDDGRYVAFASSASNLVPGDTNGQQDVFVKDVVSGRVTRVSVGQSISVPSNGDSFGWTATNDGRYVAFQSDATNIVPGDTNGVRDIFVKDMETGTLTRVSTDSNGNQSNAMSEFPNIAGDGRYVVFQSSASNLVAGDTNGTVDVFMKDLVTNVTTRISVSSAGVEGNAASDFAEISADGRYISFESSASNLVAGDTNGFDDVFVRDVVAGTTTRVSTTSTGGQANHRSIYAQISANGRYVAIYSYATNLVAGDTNGRWDTYVKDTLTNNIVRASIGPNGEQATDNVGGYGMSSDGRYVTFASASSNLVPGDTNGVGDAFLKDTVLGTLTRISVHTNGTQANGGSFYNTRVSKNGQYVIFSSDATNLVDNDTNGVRDAFMRDMVAGTTIRISQSNAGVQGNGTSETPGMSPNGANMVIVSSASNLVPGDTNGIRDVFIWRNLLTYNAPDSTFSFKYPGIFKYKDITRGSIVTYFTPLEFSANSLNPTSPFMYVSKGPNNATLDQVYSNMSNSIRKIFRNNVTVSVERTRSADGQNVRMMSFNGRVAGLPKEYTVAAIKSGTNVFVITAHATSSYINIVNSLVETAIQTRKFGTQ